MTKGDVDANGLKYEFLKFVRLNIKSNIQAWLRIFFFFSICE